MSKLNDNDIMPWGIHKGKTMGDVPDKYLLWLYRENKASGDVLDYIEDNMEAIKLNIGEEAEEWED